MVIWLSCFYVSDEAEYHSEHWKWIVEEKLIILGQSSRGGKCFSCFYNFFPSLLSHESVSGSICQYIRGFMWPPLPESHAETLFCELWTKCARHKAVFIFRMGALYISPWLQKSNIYLQIKNALILPNRGFRALALFQTVLWDLRQMLTHELAWKSKTTYRFLQWKKQDKHFLLT